MVRGVECVGATIMADGEPAFLFLCDCATTTAVRVEGITDGPREFAFTCDGCQASHWMTITTTAKEA
jgi:hypothetical protein